MGRRDGGLEGPKGPQHADLLSLVRRHARLHERSVVVLSVESHVGWEDLRDGFSQPWADFGNSCADVLAERASSWVTPSKSEAVSLGFFLQRAVLVQDRLVQAALDVAEAAPPPPRAPRLNRTPRTTFRAKADSLGHRVQVVLGGAWACSGCRDHVAPKARAAWLAQGRCVPLVQSQLATRCVPWVGSAGLHASHQFFW